MTTNTSATRNRTGMAARPAPGQTMGDFRRFKVKGWLLWTVAFVSFPSRDRRGPPLAGSMMPSQRWSGV